MEKMGVTKNCLKLEQGSSNLLQKHCVYTFTNLLPMCQLAAGWGTCAQHRATAKKDSNIPKSVCFFIYEQARNTQLASTESYPQQLRFPRKPQLGLLHRMRYDRFSFRTLTLWQVPQFSKGVRCNCGFLGKAGNSFQLSRNHVAEDEAISVWSYTSHQSPYQNIACISARILFKTGAYDGSPGSQLDISGSHLPAMGNGDVRSIAQSDITGNVLKGSVLEQIHFLLVIITARDNAFAERKYILYTCNEATQSLTTTRSKTLC